MNYRVWFKTGEPKSQLISNVRYIEIVFNTLFIQQHDGTVYEFGLAEVERLTNVSAGL